MSVVTHPAALEHARIVRVDFDEIVALVTIETAAFESKTSAPAQSVALRALHIGNRRMPVKGLKTLRRIRAHEKLNFLPAAFPHQRQRM